MPQAQVRGCQEAFSGRIPAQIPAGLSHSARTDVRTMQGPRQSPKCTTVRSINLSDMPGTASRCRWLLSAEMRARASTNSSSTRRAS